MIKVLTKIDGKFGLDQMSLEMAIVDYLVKIGVTGDAEVSLVVVGKEKMRQISTKYKKQLGDTGLVVHEVLAFPLGLEESPWNADGVKRLGDIVLLYPQTQQKLEELAVHACEHLVGINHD